MIYSNCGKASDPVEYNDRIATFRWEALRDNISVGCVSARACVYCGTINGGTCLCIGIFDCVACGQHNKPEWHNDTLDSREFNLNNTMNLSFLYGEPYNETSNNPPSNISPRIEGARVDGGDSKADDGRERCAPDYYSSY